MRRALPFVFLAASLGLGLALLAPRGANPSPQDVANDVADEVMSPFCPGVTLHDCPSEAALELRERIADWARDGMSKRQILQRLEAEYPTGIRATPPVDSRGIFAWAAPVLVLVFGAALVAWLVRGWSRRRPTGGAPPAASAAERARLERELAAFRNRV